MDYSKLVTFDFIFSLGYVTLGSSIITMILTAIIKVILKKTKVITASMDATKKDVILSRVGRIIALIVYASFYVVDVLFIKNTVLVIDITLFASLLSGSALTLCISKGFYTGLRQMSKKNSIFEKLEVAEKTIFKLQKEITDLNLQELSSEDEIKEDNINVQEDKKILDSPVKSERNRWVIKGE